MRAPSLMGALAFTPSFLALVNSAPVEDFWTSSHLTISTKTFPASTGTDTIDGTTYTHPEEYTSVPGGFPSDHPSIAGFQPTPFLGPGRGPKSSFHGPNTASDHAEPTIASHSVGAGPHNTIVRDGVTTAIWSSEPDDEMPDTIIYTETYHKKTYTMTVTHIHPPFTEWPPVDEEKREEATHSHEGTQGEHTYTHLTAHPTLGSALVTPVAQPGPVWPAPCIVLSRAGLTTHCSGINDVVERHIVTPVAKPGPEWPVPDVVKCRVAGLPADCTLSTVNKAVVATLTDPPAHSHDATHSSIDWSSLLTAHPAHTITKLSLPLPANTGLPPHFGTTVKREEEHIPSESAPTLSGLGHGPPKTETVHKSKHTQTGGAPVHGPTQTSFSATGPTYSIVKKELPSSHASMSGPGYSHHSHPTSFETLHASMTGTDNAHHHQQTTSELSHHLRPTSFGLTTKSVVARDVVITSTSSVSESCNPAWWGILPVGVSFTPCALATMTTSKVARAMVSNSGIVPSFMTSALTSFSGTFTDRPKHTKASSPHASSTTESFPQFEFHPGYPSHNSTLDVRAQCKGDGCMGVTKCSSGTTRSSTGYCGGVYSNCCPEDHPTLLYRNWQLRCFNNDNAQGVPPRGAADCKQDNGWRGPEAGFYAGCMKDSTFPDCGPA